MKCGLVLSLLIAIPCMGQTKTTGDAKAAGPCSPAVSGSNNQFIINCNGISGKQGEDFLKILNKIANDQLDPESVMGKLDEIQKSVEEIRAQAPHQYPTFTDTEKEALVAQLSQRHFTVSVSTRNPGQEAIDLATTLLNIFHHAGWITQGPNVVYGPPDIGNEGVIPIPTGLHIHARSEQYGLAVFVQQQLMATTNLDSHVEKDESVTGHDLDLFVGSPELSPRPITINPRQVAFGDPVYSTTYSFRISNNTDEDVYAITFKFRADSPLASTKDFKFDVPKSSQKPIDENDQNLSKRGDMVGLDCSDREKRPVFVTFLFHLTPHESREVTLTHLAPNPDSPSDVKGSNPVVVNSEVSYFTFNPIATSTRGNLSLIPVYLDEQLSCGTMRFILLK